MAAVALLALGLAQMAGDVLGIGALKGIGAATGASPAPKVFCSAGRLETFSTRFFVEWTARDGSARSVEITPERYSQLRGPYNRRNAYGAALAYGPVLASDDRTSPMLNSVLTYALRSGSPLLTELGIDTTDRAGPVRVRLVPREGTDAGTLPLVLGTP